MPKSNILSDHSRHDNGLCNVPSIIFTPYIRSCFFIFQGDEGTIGETGIEGDDGAKGAKGDIGAPGLRGPPGQSVRVLKCYSTIISRIKETFRFRSTDLKFRQYKTRKKQEQLPLVLVLCFCTAAEVES